MNYFTIIWVVGIGMSVATIFRIGPYVKAHPYSNLAIVFIALCGFSVFPILNILAAFAALAMHESCKDDK